MFKLLNSIEIWENFDLGHARCLRSMAKGNFKSTFDSIELFFNNSI
jgi:hypothetical protein